MHAYNDPKNNFVINGLKGNFISDFSICNIQKYLGKKINVSTWTVLLFWLERDRRREVMPIFSPFNKE